MAASCKHAPPSVSYAGNLSSSVTLDRRIRECPTWCERLSVKLTRVTVMYQPRYYRRNVDATDLVRFSAVLGETDLLVLADTNLAEQALEAVRSIRAEIQGHILNRREFVTSMEPSFVDKHKPQAQTSSGGDKTGADESAAKEIIRKL